MITDFKNKKNYGDLNTVLSIFSLEPQYFIVRSL